MNLPDKSLPKPNKTGWDEAGWSTAVWYSARNPGHGVRLKSTPNGLDWHLDVFEPEKGKSQLVQHFFPTWELCHVMLRRWFEKHGGPPLGQTKQPSPVGSGEIAGQ